MKINHVLPIIVQLALTEMSETKNLVFGYIQQPKLYLRVHGFQSLILSCCCSHSSAAKREICRYYTIISYLPHFLQAAIFIESRLCVKTSGL